jgi:hypothetical protein
MHRKPMLTRAGHPDILTKYPVRLQTGYPVGYPAQHPDNFIKYLYEDLMNQPFPILDVTFLCYKNKL